MNVLDVDDLSVEYNTQDGAIKAVRNVSFSIKEGETFGLVGESGCGKSTIAKSILRILPDNGEITNGSITLNKSEQNVDIVTSDKETLQNIRWNDISLIPQSAMNGFDPVYTISDQIVEAIQLHENIPDTKAKERVHQLFNAVGLGTERADSYPHQLSGGMRQRAMIAMALSLEPSLILADEPTTALDVITQDHILEEINDLRDQIENSMLVITHDISVVAETCDKVGVMYGGELVEAGPIEEVFVEPKHPYTLGLLNAFPTMEGDENNLITMKGAPPTLREPPTGCIFYDRCPYREPRCAESPPPLTERGDGQQAACFVSESGEEINEKYKSVVDESELWESL